MQLSWNSNSEPDIAGYRVYHRPSGGTWSLRTTSLLTNPAYEENLPFKHNGYDYQVTAVNTFGQESPPSQPVTAVGIDVVFLSDPTPNPFDLRTSLTVAVPDGGLYTRALVYDIGGRRIRVVHEGILPAGDLNLTWDGRDDSGRRVPHGIYFFQVETAEGSARKKVALSH